LEDGANTEEKVPTPVPALPAEFDQLLEHKHFTSPAADISMVIVLYRKIFPALCKRDTAMTAYCLGTTELQQFLLAPALMSSLSMLVVRFSKITTLPAMLKQGLDAQAGARPRFLSTSTGTCADAKLTFTNGHWNDPGCDVVPLQVPLQFHPKQTQTCCYTLAGCCALQ